MVQKKIIVVEDDSKNMKLFVAILRTIPNLLIIVEARGDRAVELIVKEHPDLIILDIQLPEKSGIEICKELRAIDMFKAVPIVAVTSFAMKGDRDRILDAGFTTYMSKPINVNEFREYVKRMLQD